jgi:hypothetical protein
MATDANIAVDTHVGGRVRMRRMMLSMSQESLGDAIGGISRGKTEAGAGAINHRKSDSRSEAASAPR